MNAGPESRCGIGAPGYSPACERNADPIGAVLADWLRPGTRLLEVGCGTGQHAAYIIDRLPGVHWQPSDRSVDCESVAHWRATAGDGSRIAAPVALDVCEAAQWSALDASDAVFSANTLHIMTWSACVALFERAAAHVDVGGLLCVYGPFHDGETPDSESNARFDADLRARGQGMGIRDLARVRALAARCNWLECAHYRMPANNRMLIWRRAA